jgi:hypothetical protein
MRTGFYHNGRVYVNVPVTAAPAFVQSGMRWSLPGYKVDRTACGVVAHETGHYVEHKLQQLGRLQPAVHGAQWRDVVNSGGKQVSGYEPVPSEAWAESMRLFILNPELLRAGIPARYEFICTLGLRPLKRGTWQHVLGGNKPYIEAATRWIGRR